MFMKEIIFVCLGNICRSPMAEMMFDDLINKADLKSNINVESRSTSTYEIGNAPHSGAISELKRQNIPVIEHFAEQISDYDFRHADFIVGMDAQNIIDLKNMAPSGTEEKIFKAYDILDIDKEIEDPWFDHKFNRTFTQLEEVLPQWLEKVKA